MEFGGFRFTNNLVRAFTVALLSLVAAHGQVSARELADMSIEDLLDLNLNVMSITGIHHTHEAGEFMVGYSAMFMRMEGNLDGTESVPTTDILSSYMAAPTNMDMTMHMFHLMYAPTDWMTLMMMLPYKSLTMDHSTAMGGFTTNSSGLGDLELAALFSVWERDIHRVVLTTGLGLPTGSIDEKGDTPMGHVLLPYPMQLESGSVDLIPGLTYIGQTEYWSWGIRAEGTVRLHDNDRNYRLGNRTELAA